MGRGGYRGRCGVRWEGGKVHKGGERRHLSVCGCKSGKTKRRDRRDLISSIGRRSQRGGTLLRVSVR